MITIRKAILEDKKDFSNLIMISSPYFTSLFSDKIERILQNIFCNEVNLFSFKNVYFAEMDRKNAGMVLGYDWKIKRRQNFMTGLLLFKEIGFRIFLKLLLLLRFNATVGAMENDDYYISNLATYSEYRGKGIGKLLIGQSEKDAVLSNCKRVVLDVEKDNVNAINFYKNLGYNIEKEFKIDFKDNKLFFYRMVKLMNINYTQNF